MSGVVERTVFHTTAILGRRSQPITTAPCSKVRPQIRRTGAPGWLLKSMVSGVVTRFSLLNIEISAMRFGWGSRNLGPTQSTIKTSLGIRDLIQQTKLQFTCRDCIANWHFGKLEWYISLCNQIMVPPLFRLTFLVPSIIYLVTHVFTAFSHSVALWRFSRTDEF
jgi:hypothetical protein